MLFNSEQKVYAKSCDTSIFKKTPPECCDISGHDSYALRCSSKFSVLFRLQLFQKSTGSSDTKNCIKKSGSGRYKSLSKAALGSQVRRVLVHIAKVWIPGCLMQKLSRQVPVIK